MRSVQHTATLVYYDGVQVFEGRDRIGGHYVGVMVDTVDDADRYLVTGVAPERLRQFRSGDLDLRTLLLEAGEDGWYFANVADDFQQPLQLVRQNGYLEGQEFLPDAGFVLHDDPTDDTAVHEARKRNNVVLELSVEPPEAAYTHRIRMTTLSGLLAHFQAVVKYAYRKAVKESNTHTTDGYLMDVVVPAHPGSFRVTMEATDTPNLFGDSKITQGLERMDSLFMSATDPETARERMQEHSGHLAGSYIKLMRFLSEHDTGMRYVWAGPALDKPRRGGVSKALARELVDELSKASNLEVEKVTLIGTLLGADCKPGGWKLKTSEGDKSGKIRDDGPNLNGMVIGNRYTFYCFDEFEIVDASGRERHTLYLEKYEPA